jgi:hypothetical protein
VLHADYDVFALAPHQPFVAAARAFIHSRSQFLAVGFGERRVMVSASSSRES